MSSVFGKIIETFSSKKPPSPRETAARERHAKSLLCPSGLSSARISSSRVRLVVFRDDKGVKQQLYDSQSRSDNSEEQCSHSMCDMRSGEQILDSSVTSSSSLNHGRTQSAGWNKTPTSVKTRRAAFIRRASTDAELLGEMMFGSMPMKTVGDTVKVHYIRSTDQLMLTKVFTTQRRSTISQCALSPDYNSDSCPLIEPANGGSPSGYVSSVEKSFVGKGPVTKSLQQMRSVSPETSKHRSSSLSVPIVRSRISASSLSPSTTPPSPHSPQQLNGSNGISSSLTRRILRSRSTSLENGSELYRRVLKPLDQCSSRKGKRCALGVIICLSELSKDDIRHFQSFLFSHFTLIDAHLERLKEAVEDACHYRGNTIAQMLTKGYNVFLESFLSLYEAPRIESPVWLSLVSERDRQRAVCMQFMEELGSAIVELDTKDTKYFLSSLLTAVLTHHLAWVYTVSKQGSDRHHKSAGKSLGVLAESHPYNPLWAQLGDMYGAVSHPLKIARTVITGQSLSIVCRLLYLLTYFIRCSEIQPGFVQVLSQELADTDSSITKQGSSEMSQDCDDQSHDPSCALEESDLFPVSRASSCTVVSEQDKRVLSPAASIDRDTPVVRPHPFSFRTTPLSTTASSTDSYHRHHYNSESDCYEHTSDTASYRAVRSKSNSFNYSGEYSTSVPNGSQKSSPLIAGTVAKQQQYTHMKILTAGEASDTLCTCTCDDRDHPIASKDGNGHVFGYRQFRCQCHYGDPRSCAFDPSSESMGFCPIDNGFLTFDPSRRYSDDKGRVNPLINSGVIAVNSAPSVTSSDDVSLSSNFSQSPHSIPAPGIILGSPPYPASTPKTGCPYNQCHNEVPTNVIRTSCTSIDSGYEKSMSMSSFTCSTKEPTSVTISPQPQYSSTGDVSVPSLGTQKPSDIVETKPRARSLCEIEQKQDTSLSSGCAAFGSGMPMLYPKLHVPQLVVEDLTLTNQHLLDVQANTSITSMSSSDGSTPVALMSKSATPSPTNSVQTATKSMKSPPLQALSKTELRRAFFASKGKAKGIRTIEDSKMKQEQSVTSASRPRSDAVSFAVDSYWKTKSCDCHVTSDQVSTPTCSDENHVTSTPTYFGSRTLGTHAHSCHQKKQSSRFNGTLNTCSSGYCPMDADQCTPQQQLNFNSSSLYQSLPVNVPGSKSSTIASISTAVGGPPVLVLPSDTQSIVSEADSGHCTKSIDIDGISQASELSHMSYPDNASEFSENEDVFPARLRKNICPSQNNQLRRVNEEMSFISSSPERSLTASCLKLHRDNPSLLQEKLREYETVISAGGRPRMLEQFEDFTDVDLPTCDEFILDDLPSEAERGQSDRGQHRHRIGDFGHSLFAGHSPSYLPDFILHGTSEPANDEFVNKLADDLSNMVKHSIIDEPIDYGVGIIADTDNWSVKIMSATKNLHTSDIIVGTGAIKPSQYVKQLLSSVKSMYEMRMPPEFCLSYLEDRLLELNERSQLLTSALQRNPEDADLADIVPHAVAALNVNQSDIPLLLAVSAANCSSPDVSAYLNYQHMKMVLGKQFI